MNPKELIKKTLMLTGSLFYNNHGSKILYYHDVYRTINYRALDADINMGTPLDLFKRHVVGETGACWDSMGGIKQCRNLHFRAGRQD